MLAALIGMIGCLIALIGWFGFDSVLLLIVGTAFYLVETFLERKSLNDGAKTLDFIIFGIGCVVALIVKVPFYVGGMVAINCYSALFSVFTLIMYIKIFWRLR